MVAPQHVVVDLDFLGLSGPDEGSKSVLALSGEHFCLDSDVAPLGANAGEAAEPEDQPESIGRILLGAGRSGSHKPDLADLRGESEFANSQPLVPDPRGRRNLVEHLRTSCAEVLTESATDGALNITFPEPPDGTVPAVVVVRDNDNDARVLQRDRGRGRGGLNNSRDDEEEYGCDSELA